MKRRFTNSERVAGERAVRDMSRKAQTLYSETDPLVVYEYDADEEDEEKRYAYSGCFGEDENLTFDELQDIFEELSDLISEEEGAQ